MHLWLPGCAAESRDDSGDQTEISGGEESDETADNDSGGTETTADPAGDGDGDGDGDTGWQPPLDDVLRLNHVQLKGTHNSYHVEPPIVFSDQHRYTHQPLDVQLEDQGVRAFEIDVHQGSGGLEVYHIDFIDEVSTCDTFALCMQTIRGWSDTNRKHLPIVVWIEVKDDVGGVPIDDLSVLDDELRAVFDEERLYTPDDLQGSYESPRARLDAEGWPTLGEVRGKVIAVLLDSDRAGEYTDGFTTSAGKAMFANAPGDHYLDGWAAMTKINSPTAADAIAAAHAANLMIASNTCGADESDETCVGELAAGFANGSHFLKDDFPAPVPEREYFADFADGNPARCNEVTAPAECTSEALEDLDG